MANCGRWQASAAGQSRTGANACPNADKGGEGSRIASQLGMHGGSFPRPVRLALFKEGGDPFLRVGGEHVLDHRARCAIISVAEVQPGLRCNGSLAKPYCER